MTSLVLVHFSNFALNYSIFGSNHLICTLMVHAPYWGIWQ